MLRSLYSGVAGLTTHQAKMDVIGNNIANVNTYGFKSSRVTFRDVYYQTSTAATAGTQDKGGNNPSEVGYGVQLGTIDKNMSRSSFQGTDRTLDCAISGEGFFQAKDAAGNVFYTRLGAFNVDSDGNLVDTTNKFILGACLSGDDVYDVGNLPQEAASDVITINVPSLEAQSGAGKVNIGINNVPLTVSFGYTPEEAAQSDMTKTNMSIKFNVISSTAAGAAEGARMENGVLVVDIFDTTVSGATDLTSLNEAVAATVQAGIDAGTLNATDLPDGKMPVFSFDEDAQTAAIEAYRTANNIDPADDVDFEGDVIPYIFGAANMSDIGGTVKLSEGRNFAEQSFKDLTSFTIDASGIITGTHQGKILTFGRIDLATFDNPEGLNQAGDTYFTETSASGEPGISIAGTFGAGNVVSGKLEMSNVNLAQEFSDMIITQRGFQANSRIITTSDTMLEELVNLKR